jgi:hypothetical protein
MHSFTFLSCAGISINLIKFWLLEKLYNKIL